MDFDKVLKERYSVRAFSDRKVEKEKIEKILQAARSAPTAKNNQPQKIFVLQSDDALQKFKKCTKFHFNAPLAFLVCYDKTVSWKSIYGGHEFGDLDGSIITAYMMLEAVNLGLGTTWVGLFDRNVVKEVFGLDDSLVPLALLPTGYAAEDCKPSERHFDRKDLSETAVWL